MLNFKYEILSNWQRGLAILLIRMSKKVSFHGRLESFAGDLVAVSPRCDFELIFIVYLVGDVAARHPSPRVHQLGDPSNSIWSYSRNYNQTRYEVINLF